MKAYLEPEEVTLMENAASNLRDKILIRLLFRLGCRISEALALKVEDVDFTQAAVTIVHLKRSLKLSCSKCGARLGAAHTYCPKCGSKIEKSHIEELQNRRQRVLPIEAQGDVLGHLGFLEEIKLDECAITFAFPMLLTE